MRLSSCRATVVGCLLAGLGSLILTQAAAPPGAQGLITAKEFLDINGTVLTDLTGSPKFPDSPDVIGYPKFFEWPAGADDGSRPPDDVKNNYGVQVIGFLYPPTTGDYVFFLAADDQAALYLSTDDNPANKTEIAREPSWNPVRAWTSATRRTLVDTGTADERYNNVSKRIRLETGKAYYIEALMKEGGGGDNVAVTWQMPGGFLPTDGDPPIPGQYLATIDKTSGPVRIATQPQSQSIDQGNPVTFSVIADGTPPYTYQWKKGGTDISGATGLSYSISRVATADNNASFTVVVTGAQGTITSSPAVLTVISDTAPPTVQGVTGSEAFNSVTVTFSEPVDPATAQVASNYRLSGGVTVSAAALAAAAGTAGDNRVVLTTSRQSENTSLTLTISNLRDTAGNTIAANTTADFKTFVFQTGVVLHKFWANNPANNLAALTNNARFPNAPTMVTLEPFWEYGPNGSGESGSNYGNQLVGWFLPPQTGNYIFFTNSDDPSNLYLSTDDNPANKHLIAQEAGWSGVRNWVSVGATSTIDDKRSDFFVNSEWPTFAGFFAIPLQAGRRYYMESIHTEGGGGDSVAATFIMEGEADPVNGSAPRLTGPVIGAYLDPNGASVTFNQPPQNVTVQENRKATFTVTATGTSAYGPNVTYQWETAPQGSSTFTAIAGATGTSFSTPFLNLADSGKQYRVIATVPTLSQPSAPATVTVIPDTFAPVIKTVGAMRHGNNWEIGIIFDEKIATGATTLANYTLAGGSVSAPRYLDNSSGIGDIESGVVLTTSGLTAGTPATITVRGLADAKGNTMTDLSMQFTPSHMQWTSIGRVGQFQPDAIAVAEDGFNLLSGGEAYWGNNDDITFVYEQITGDFDKVARVEWQDPSSQWARAGIAARETLNANEATAGNASRYQMIHLSPDFKFDGTPANRAYETNRRLAIDGATDAAGSGGAPTYPNSWVRLQRVGQSFTMHRSSDGRDWIQVGAATDFSSSADGPLPDQLFVGPVYGPENGNITPENLRQLWSARIRDYGDFTEAAPEATLTVGLSGNTLTVSWTPSGGTLESATVVTGPWSVAGTANPAAITISPTENRFYRVRSP